MDNKTNGQLLEEKLLYKKDNITLKLTNPQREEMGEINEQYKSFLDNARTERHAANAAIIMLQENGFELFEKDKTYKPGDRVYKINRGKTVVATVFGTEDLEKGIHMIASHIDSPRLDLKQNPLYEDNQLALFKTHYYGGIKKYQWTAIPLALLGVMVKNDGTVVDINIGLDENDPVFCVTDLLPHLADEQMKQTLSQGIKGEQLNILAGSDNYDDEKVKEKVKLNILHLLNQKYDVTEADFLSAEIEAVPAFGARDVGLDCSMVGAYGQDDRVCAFFSLLATVKTKTPKYTTLTVLADKEEVGSDGNTGLASSFLKYFVYDLAENKGVNARTVLSNSKCLSADVSAGFDPTFPEVLETKNAAFLNHGPVIMKYTGARGKGGTSDASAEFMGEVRQMLDNAGINWQTAELGKVDQGGGGTVALFVANLDVDVIDIGVPVLSMHAPFEITAKADNYMLYKAFCEFYK